MLHALIVALPVLKIYTSLSVPMELEIPEEETIVEDGAYTHSLKTDWWMSLLLWPALFWGVAFALSHAFKFFSGQALVWVTPAYSALLTALLIFALCFFYGNVLVLKSPFCVGEEGIRLSLVHFAPWEDVHHVQENHGVYLFYLTANPHLPMASVRPRDQAAQDTLLNMLTKKEVMGTDHSPPMLAAVKGAIIGIFTAMIALGLILENYSVLDPRWTILILFVVGIVLCLGLERFRGIHKLIKIDPRVGEDLQDARAAAYRALCLATMVSRGKLEDRLRKAQARGNESIHKEIHRLGEWVEEQDLMLHLSDEEEDLLRRPAGTWTLQQANDACWKSEALGTLLWAMKLQPTLPHYDTPFSWEELEPSLPLLGDVSLFLGAARLQPEETISQSREVAELWHWRARTTHIVEQGMESPEGFTWEEIIAHAAQAAFESQDIPQPLSDDFPAFGIGYKNIDQEQYRLATSIATERHFALNWLCFYAIDWDETPTDT